MSLCTFMLYLCFCPGEVTLQHAGKLVCMNCYGVEPFHSVRQYLLSYSVNCYLPLAGGEGALSTKVFSLLAVQTLCIELLSVVNTLTAWTNSE